MYPNLDEEIVFPVSFQNGQLVTSKEYIVNMFSKKDIGDIAMLCHVLDSEKATHDIEKLIDDFIDKYASEVYEDVKKDEIESNQTQEEMIKCKIPSTTSYAEWVKDQLEYDNYLDDFVDLELDIVASNLKNADINEIKNALINLYRQNPQKTWKDCWLSDDDIIAAVQNKIEKGE